MEVAHAAADAASAIKAMHVIAALHVACADGVMVDPLLGVGCGEVEHPLDDGSNFRF